MQAGRLRHRVTLQVTALSTADSFGEQTQSWADVERDIPAEVQTLSAIELWKTAQVQPEASVQVFMRYRSDVTSAHRFIYGSRYLYPITVIPDIKNTELTILCKEK